MIKEDLASELWRAREQIDALQGRIARQKAAFRGNMSALGGNVCCPICTHYFHLPQLINAAQVQEKYELLLAKRAVDLKKRRERDRKRRKK